MSSIFSTQNRQTFLRRKYCFFPTAAALSPPVGRCEAAIGLPPLGSGIMNSPLVQPARARPYRTQAPRARGAPALRLQVAPLEWGLRATDAPDRRLPPFRPTSVAPEKAAAPPPADAGAPVFPVPSSVCRDASKSRRYARSGT